jgi:hypothetical protein
MRARTWVLAGVVAGAPACTTVFGDVVFVGSGGGTSTGGSSTGGMDGGTTTGTTGDSGVCDAGACDADAGMMACGCSCVDVQTDQHNCGRCQHDCLAGQCMNGVCQAWTVVANTTVGTGLDSDGKYVVWDDNSLGVHVIKADGTGGITTFTQTESAGSGVSLKGGTVAFANGTSIFTAPEGQATAAAHAMPSTGGSVKVIALDAAGTSGYFFYTGSPWGLENCSLPTAGSGSCTTFDGFLAGGPGAVPSSLHVNTSYAFWLWSCVGCTSLGRYSFANASGTQLARPAGALALDANNVYWVEGTGASSSAVYSLPQSFSTSPSPTPQTVATIPALIGSLATDGTHLYMGTGAVAGTPGLYYAPIGPVDGGAPILMFASASSGSSQEETRVVATGGAIFWADANSGTSAANIMGIAPP